MNSNMPAAGKNDVDLVLIGKTGNGKSATGNSILRKRAFKSMSTTQSVTLHVDYDYSEFRGRIIKVVDGPGVGDTRMDDETAKKLLQTKFEEAVLNNPQGYHAFIIVVRFGCRFTTEDVQTIKILKQIFGLDFVKKYCILVFSCGDNFEMDQEGHGMTFEDWCRAQGGIFQEILSECNGRAIVFNNALRDDARREEQVARLLQVVDSLGGVRYTDANFKKAQHLRDKQMLEAKEPQIQESTIKEATVLSQRLQEIQKKDLQEQIPELEQLLARAEKLYQDVRRQDKGMNVLKHALHAALSILEQTKSQKEYCFRTLEERQAAAERQEKIRAENEARRAKEHEEFEIRMAEERSMFESKRQEEQAKMNERYEQERVESERRHQEGLATLREEMQNKSEEERRQREKEFEEREKRRREEDNVRYEREKEQLDARIAEERVRSEREMERHREMMEKMDRDSNQRMEQMMTMFRESAEAAEKRHMETLQQMNEATQQQLRAMRESRPKGGCVVM